MNTSLGINIPSTSLSQATLPMRKRLENLLKTARDAHPAVGLSAVGLLALTAPAWVMPASPGGGFDPKPPAIEKPTQPPAASGTTARDLIGTPQATPPTMPIYLPAPRPITPQSTRTTNNQGQPTHGASPPPPETKPRQAPVPKPPAKAPGEAMREKLERYRRAFLSTSSAPLPAAITHNKVDVGGHSTPANASVQRPAPIHEAPRQPSPVQHEQRGAGFVVPGGRSVQSNGNGSYAPASGRIPYRPMLRQGFGGGGYRGGGGHFGRR